MICAKCQREIAEYSNFCYYCGSRQATAQGPARVRPSKSLVRPANRAFAGVLAGFADYLDVDVVLARVIYILITLFSGLIPGIVAYIISWMVIPDAAAAQARPAAQPASPSSAKRLFRSRTDKKFGGVCAGVADYLGADATVVRLLWAILTVIPGAIVLGMLAYVICWIVIPEAPELFAAPATQAAPAQNS